MSQLTALATFNVPTIQIYNLTLDGITPAACQFNVPTSAAIVRARIINLHGTNTVAVTLATSAVATVPDITDSTTSQTTPTATFLTSTFIASASAAVAAGDGIRVQPGQTLEINVTGGTKIWLTTNAGPTPVQVAGILQNG